jgi:hypothetical protein
VNIPPEMPSIHLAKFWYAVLNVGKEKIKATNKNHKAVSIDTIIKSRE